MTPVRAIGVDAGDSRLEFGNIEAIAADESRGVIFVLDRINHRLSAVTRDGRFLATTGRKGSGPGEFWWADGMVARGSTVYVYDSGHGRITIYLFQSNAFALQGTWRVPFQGSDMCLLGDQVFVLGYRHGRLVHRIAPDGTVAASFGRPFREDDPMIAELAAHGHVICDSASQSVYVTSIVTPTVRRYSAAGQLLWETLVPGGFLRTIVTRERNMVWFRRPPGGANADVIVSLAVIPGGRLILQYGRGLDRPATRDDMLAVTSVVYDVRNGAVLAVRRDLPRIDFASGRYAYSRANDPFPRVRIYELR